MLICQVTPCVGVWIETPNHVRKPAEEGGSHPAWVCGLKPYFMVVDDCPRCHTLRGCVD